MHLLGMVMMPLVLMAHSPDIQCVLLEDAFEQHLERAVSDGNCKELAVSIHILNALELKRCFIDKDNKELKDVLPRLYKKYCPS